MSFGMSGANPEDFGKPGDRELYVANMHVYREWRFGQIGPYLTSLASPMPWPSAGWSEALCTKGGFEACSAAPAEACTCGFYGWYRPDRTWAGTPAVFGVAEVAGTCVLGSVGLRAARMRPLALVMAGLPPGCGCAFCRATAAGTDHSRELVEEAVHKYLPGLKTFATREDLMEVYPASDWASIVGHPIPTYADQVGDGLSPEIVAMARAMGIDPRQLMLDASRQAQMALLQAQQQIQIRLIVTEPEEAPEPEPESEPETPKTRAELALEARRNRSTGPSWLRDPFTRRGRS